jgi:hypothetical protein
VVASGIMPKGFPFSIGFRVLFEKNAFKLKAVFEGWPTEEHVSVLLR